MLVRPSADDEIDAGRNVSGNAVHLIVILIMSEPQRNIPPTRGVCDVRFAL